MSPEKHLPTSPPPEVKRAIAAAAEAYEVLSGAGQQVHFGTDRSAEPVAVELRALAGDSLSPLSPGDVLQLADGEELR